jgi:hypothetical protein
MISRRRDLQHIERFGCLIHGPGSKISGMKHAMTLALIAGALLTAPVAQADPDPHKPDIGANFCPGGGTPPPEATCDGIPYDSGSYWHAIQHGQAPSFMVVVQCVQPPPQPGIFAGLVPKVTGPVPAPPGSCA